MPLSESTRNRLKIAEPIILVIAIIAMGFFMYTVYSGDGAECLANPLVYGVKDLSETNDAPLMCQCEFIGSHIDTIIEVTPEGSSFRDKKEVPFRLG